MFFEVLAQFVDRGEPIKPDFRMEIGICSAGVGWLAVICSLNGFACSSGCGGAARSGAARSGSLRPPPPRDQLGSKILRVGRDG